MTNKNYSKIYLCKPNRNRLGILNVKEETVSLKKKMADIWELSFEVEKYVCDINDSNGLVENSYYDSISESMEIYIDGEIDAYFQIVSDPEVSNDGTQETKTITALSIECELQNKFLKRFKINCGTEESLEYLADDNIDDYTTLPKEYISLINYDNHQLSLLHLAIEKSHASGWTVRSGIDEVLCSKKYCFDIDSQDVYSFLTQKLSSTAKVLIDFDRKTKTIGLIASNEIGEDTGVMIGMRNLMNSLTISTANEDNIKTKFYVNGADDLGIEYVNFGEDYITNYDYFMNAVTKDGNLKYVDQELLDAYNAWKNYRDNEAITINGTEYESRRVAFKELTKLYNKTILDISELTYRLPNDGCNIDYRTFKFDELQTAYTAYNNAVVALLVLYKSDVIADNDLNPNTVITIDYSNGYALSYDPVPDIIPDATLLPDSIYWRDYYSYTQSIIPQVEEALKMYCATDSNGDLVPPVDGEFTELEGGNNSYNTGTYELKTIDSWKYEWELYGLNELIAKKKAWLEQYHALNENNTDGNNTERLLWYMSETPIENGLTNTTDKGVVISCIEKIAERQAEIDAIKVNQNIYEQARTELQEVVMVDSMDDNNEYIHFNESQIALINILTREADYSNENILSTSLDDVVSTIDDEEELYQDAIIALEKQSQPQYSFSVELDNLYELEEFKPMADKFELNNFIRVGLGIYDNYFTKLRLVGITYNPCIPDSNLDVEFSNMTHTRNMLDDLTYIFEEMSGGSSSSGGSSGSSSSGSSGTFGKNDAEIQISNNMLNALLKAGTLTTAVSTVLIDNISNNTEQFNTIVSNSGLFKEITIGVKEASENAQEAISTIEELTAMNGSTTIYGGLISSEMIKSNNYNTTNHTGSMIDLTNGNFSFAGEKLVYDGTDLMLQGNINAEGGIIAGWDISNTCLYKGNSNFYNANSMYFGDLGISIKNKFKVDSNGKLTATGANITGMINATSGTFTGNIISTATISGGEIEGAIINNGDDTFSVDEGGNCIANSFTSSNVNITGGLFNLKHDGFDINTLTYDDVLHEYYKVYETTVIHRNAFDSISYASLEYLHISYDTDLKMFFVKQKSDNRYDFTDSYDVEGCFNNGSLQQFRYLYDFGGYKYIFYNGILYKYQSEFLVDNNPSYNYIYTYYKVNENGILDRSTDYYLVGKIFTLPHDMWSYEGNISSFLSSIGINVYETFLNNVGYFIIDPYDISGTASFSIKQYRSYGAEINFKYLNHNLSILTTGITGYDNNDICNWGIGDNIFRNLHAYDQDAFTGLSKRALYVGSDGTISAASSSKRYKQDISSTLTEFNPHGIYDLPVCQYRYNEENGGGDDSEYMIGFIAEDVAEYFPIASRWNKDHTEVDTWEMSDMFPAVVKLVQEQHEEIEMLKEEVNELKRNKIKV